MMAYTCFNEGTQKIELLKKRYQVYDQGCSKMSSPVCTTSSGASEDARESFFESTWDIVEAYARESNGQALVKHLHESFNDFIGTKLEQIIEGFNSIDLNYQFLPEANVFKYVLQIQLKNPVISKPTIVEKNGSTKTMTPDDARNRNFTYAAPLHVDMHVTAKTYNVDTAEYTEDFKKLANVLLGKIPIMVRSKYCVLNNHPSARECMFDTGGYFIINGCEKVVISQDKIAENKTHVFLSNKVSTYSHVAEIRSIEDNRYAVPKTTSLKLSSKSNPFGRSIRCAVHHIKHDVPLFIVFKALGIENDRDIVEHIVYDLEDSHINKRLIQELAACADEANGITTMSEAREYMLKYMNVSGYPKEFLSNKYYRLDILNDIFHNDLLPHVGKTDLRQKALYLGMMAQRLLMCYLGIIPIDDRDSYLNKRIDAPGVLMASLFRQYYGKMIKDMRNTLQKDIHNGPWKATHQLINVVSKVNINKVVKSTIIESGLKYGLATGNWGIKSNKTKQGVAQVLNRMTYNATLSHLRRINTPIEKTGKLIQPRKLHATQWGIICPAETPEGASVGLVKNMAFMCTITIASNSTSVYETLEREGMQPYQFQKDLKRFSVDTKILVNGNLTGTHPLPVNLVARLKAMKRHGILHPMTSIVWDIPKQQLSISTEAGRCTRPLYIIEKGACCITPKVIKLLKAGKVGWIDLVIGNAEFGIEPVIEYLDVEECNHAMIAMRITDIGTKMTSSGTPIQYTHLEMDPSLILGVLAGSIPFSNHNQAPRNAYQSAMGKQAIGLYSTNYLNRYDTMAHVLNYPQKPLVQTRMGKLIHGNELCAGANVMVAIATYTGFNQEDSIIMNKSAVDRGMFQSTYYRTYKEQNNKNHSTGEEEYFCKPVIDNSKTIKPFNYEKLDETGFVPENTYVTSGDVIIGKCMPQKTAQTMLQKDTSVYLKNNEKGFVDRNGSHDKYFTNTNGDGYTFCKVRLRSYRVPTIGDKFCVPAEAEVLTANRGWISIAKVTSGDLVAQLDPVTHTVQYVNPLRTYTFYHDGLMYRCWGDTVDLLSTMEHKMVVAPASDPKAYRLVEAKDIVLNPPGDWVYKLSANNGVYQDNASADVFECVEGGLRMPMDDWIVLYAHWLRLSHLDISKRVFTIFDRNSSNDLQELSKHYAQLGPYDANQCAWIIQHPDVYAYLNMIDRPFLPNWIFERLSTLQARTIINIVLAGYGYDARTGTGNAYSCATWMADELQRLALHAGYAARVDLDPINIRKASLMLYRREPNETNYKHTTKRWSGHVYCLEVPSHMFYMRMNGKALWTGNSSRHGQKGTVGMLYRQEDMPFNKDGISPDIIINPHCIPSRMTIAQLMECIMGKACALQGTYGDATPFTDLSIDDISKELEHAGVECFGNEVMYNSRTGEQIPCLIFMGPTYYQRLKHMTDDKQHSRSANGPVVLLTRQPAEGRARDGGLRLGEMEVECNWAHGTMQFLKERFMECSDNYRVFVCKKCGMMADVNPEKNIFRCRACKDANHFSELRIPYACKLMFQEIQTMSIATRFLT